MSTPFTTPAGSWDSIESSKPSFGVVQFDDAARLALEPRHTNQELLFRHYRELVTPDQAEKYWDIRPAMQTNVVAITA
ncbi:MAG TPA: hypothetical protein VN939_18255 [Chthoniobacterales bacterium]|jgi:hypothetical protein|nr:hypothetical protein [Chthoniobacterales bacterium]